MITAKIIEDSISPQGIRLTTMQLCYPRFIHAEFMTHRVFSRNASSSRAIPVEKMLDMVRNDPATPIHWGKNQPGMQAHEQLEGNALVTAKCCWFRAAEEAADTAETMMAAGAHKQIVNRILEPFQHIHVVVTATEWSNFFLLREHPDAQPEIHELAIQMKRAMEESIPKTLQQGDWHLPYVVPTERGYSSELLRCISAARCARVSYLTHDGQTPDIEKDLALYDRLVGSVPVHASPVEHQATPDEPRLNSAGWAHPGQHGNFTGWIQFRKLIEQHTGL